MTKSKNKGQSVHSPTFSVDIQAPEEPGRLGYGGDERPVVGLFDNAAAATEWSFNHPEISTELEGQGIYPLIPRFLKPRQLPVAVQGSPRVPG
ncbi:hypothetical protein GCM10027580_22370 [Corynebacterium faecale]